MFIFPRLFISDLFFQSGYLATPSQLSSFFNDPILRSVYEDVSYFGILTNLTRILAPLANYYLACISFFLNRKYMTQFNIVVLCNCGYTNASLRKKQVVYHYLAPSLLKLHEFFFHFINFYARTLIKKHLSIVVILYLDNCLFHRIGWSCLMQTNNKNSNI